MDLGFLAVLWISVAVSISASQGTCDFAGKGQEVTTTIVFLIHDSVPERAAKQKLTLNIIVCRELRHQERLGTWNAAK